MRIDNETGNITHVDYESYIEKKEEYEAKSEEANQRIEDLEDEIYDLKEQLKKDSLVAPNESK